MTDHDARRERPDRSAPDETEAGASAPEPSLVRRTAGATSRTPFGPQDLTDAPPDDPGPGRVNAAAATFGSGDSTREEPPPPRPASPDEAEEPR